MKFLDLDSPLMRFLTRVAELMIINVYTLLLCIPIITAGPALTAAHYTSLKLIRDEGGYVTGNYFKSFKQNFKQGVLIGLLFVLVAFVLLGDYYIIKNAGTEFNSVLKIALIVVGVIIIMTGMYVFPVLAKFDNTIWATIRNAAIMSVLQLPKTFIMAILYVIPIFVFAFAPQAFPVILMLGISVPIYLSAMLYNKFFERIEDSLMANQMAEAKAAGETEEADEEDDSDRIFSDKLDEALITEHMDK